MTTPNTPAPAGDDGLPEYVAEVRAGWALVWAGTEPIAHLLARHPGVRIGSKLYTADQMRAAIAAKEAELAKLRTVMVAAAEEIAAHWEAHCDAEGYGPQNLMRRLEEGIPSEYGYTAGRFAEMHAELSTLREQLNAAQEDLRKTHQDALEISEQLQAADHINAGLEARLKEAGLDAARLRECALKYLDYLQVANPQKALAEDVLDPEMVGAALAAKGGAK